MKTGRRSSARMARRAAAALCLLATVVSAKPDKKKRAPRPEAAAPAVDAPAHSESVPGSVSVTVVEVAGSQAYLSPGAREGVRRGSAVTIHRKKYIVLQATDSFSTIFVGSDGVAEQDKGQATTVDDKSAKAVELEKPKPLSIWQHAWTQAAAPATSQSPRFIPLGTTERDRRWDVRLSTSFGALLPLGARGSTLTRAELETRVHAAPFDSPAALDLDVAVQRWFDANLSDRAGAAARPLITVRELFASYASGGYFGGLGRMRYASRTLGTLDGARASAPLGSGFSLGAFGGVLPDPLNGAFSTKANRFGVEASYSRPDAELRPDVALVAHGSMFEGSLDERRLSGAFGLYPGHSRLGGYFEVSAFDASNPWKAKPFELTAAGLDTSVRAGAFQFGGRFDLRQPERSRWLAFYLPPTWFCPTVPSAPGATTTPEACDGTVSTRASGVIDAGVDVDPVSIVVGGTTMGDLTLPGSPNMTGAFVSGRVVRILRVLRFEGSASYSRATYIDMIGASVGPGFLLFGDALDVSTYYRIATLEYRASPASLVQHGVGGYIVALPSSDLLVAVQGEAMGGSDANALALFGTITWRPSL